MKILFIHPNMPGQYKHLAPEFAKDPDNQVVFLTKPKPNVNLPNVIKMEYQVTRQVLPDIHRYLIPVERAVNDSQEVWRMCNKMKQEGFVPDVIVGHLGFGDGLYLKDVYRDTPVISLLEYFYSPYGADVSFLDEDTTKPDNAARIRTKNAIHLLNLTYIDWGVCPTFFQRDQHPELFHQKISVLHDGVNTDAAKPDPDLTELKLPNGKIVKREDEIITYITRNFEPYRGFPTFMRAAEILLKERPNCQIVVLGADEVSYGKEPKNGQTWRQKMMNEVNLDMSRFHVSGHIPYDEMLKIMQISSAHIYLTVPFVLSWSMLESMACGCALVASNTEPVLEVVEDGKNALLADFFSERDVADKVSAILDHPDRMQDMREEARRTVEKRYALSKLLPLNVALIKDIAAGKTPPPVEKEIANLYA